MARRTFEERKREILNNAALSVEEKMELIEQLKAEYEAEAASTRSMSYETPEEDENFGDESDTVEFPDVEAVEHESRIRIDFGAVKRNNDKG